MALSMPIVVIGGGVAGMGAALELANCGHQVLLIEQKTLGFFKALAPLNCFLVQNLIAVTPNGRPLVVIAILECINIPHFLYCIGLPNKSLLVGTIRVNPIAALSSRW